LSSLVFELSLLIRRKGLELFLELVIFNALRFKLVLLLCVNLFFVLNCVSSLADFFCALFVLS